MNKYIFNGGLPSHPMRGEKCRISSELKNGVTVLFSNPVQVGEFARDVEYCTKNDLKKDRNVIDELFELVGKELDSLSIDKRTGNYCTASWVIKKEGGGEDIYHKTKDNLEQIEKEILKTIQPETDDETDLL